MRRYTGVFASLPSPTRSCNAAAPVAIFTPKRWTAEICSTMPEHHQTGDEVRSHLLV